MKICLLAGRPAVAAALLGVLLAASARADEIGTAAPAASGSTAPVDEVAPAERPQWLFWVVAGVGTASMAAGALLFADYALASSPALAAARRDYDDPNLVCPGTTLNKQCFADQVQLLELIVSVDLAVGSVLAAVGSGLLVGAFAELFPYGE